MPRLHPRVPPPPPPRPRRPRAVQPLLNRCRWSRIGTRYPRFRKAQICGKSCTTAKVLYCLPFNNPSSTYLLSCLLTHNFLPTLPCFYTRQLGAHFVADRKPPRELAAAEGRYGSARGYDAKAEEHDAYVQRSSGCVLSSCFFHVEKMTEYFTNLM